MLTVHHSPTAFSPPIMLHKEPSRTVVNTVTNVADVMLLAALKVLLQSSLHCTHTNVT